MGIRRYIPFISICIIFLSISAGFAEEFPYIYKGVRPLGMGNTFIAIADDGNALFYNPAGLNGIQGFGGMEVLNPLIEFSKVGLDAYNDFKDIDSNNVVEVTKLLNKYVGKRFSLRTALFPHAIFHNFAIGFLAQAKGSGEVRNMVNPQINVDERVDIGGIAGIAYGFMDGKIQAGVVIKFLQRQSYKTTYYATDIAAKDFDPAKDFDKKKVTGTGLSGDMGVKINTLWPLRPTFAAVISNIGDLDLDKAGTIPQQINVGIAIHPDTGSIKNIVTLDILDITKNVSGEDDFYKRLHMGIETKLPYILSLRAGLNQGYSSFGATIDFWLLKLDYAYYKEEIGVVAGQKADARHVFQVAVGF